jgi:hypothetical protein
LCGDPASPAHAQAVAAAARPSADDGGHNGPGSRPGGCDRDRGPRLGPVARDRAGAPMCGAASAGCARGGVRALRQRVVPLRAGERAPGELGRFARTASVIAPTPEVPACSTSVKRRPSAVTTRTSQERRGQARRTRGRGARGNADGRGREPPSPRLRARQGLDEPRGRVRTPPRSRERRGSLYDPASTCSRCPLPLTGKFAWTLPVAS